MQASLSRQCVHISEKVVQRLMKQECLVAVTRKRRRYGSYMGEISPAPDNLLHRNFSASAPNEKWLVASVDAYIRWYNEGRIKISLGFRSPIEHRRNLGLAA